MPKNKNRTMLKAKREKNDEFYTLYEDIENELQHYYDFLKDKVIYCNCDNPFKSNFVKYFLVNFNSLGLKKLYATCYSPVNIQEDLFSDNILVNDKAYFLEVNKVDKNLKKEQELKLILDNALKNKENHLSELKGNGSFDSEECLSILDKSDIVITNPPFSIALEFYLPLLVEHNKDFLIIGDLNMIPKAFVFPLIVKNKIWLGYNSVKEFLNPDGCIKKFGNKLWFTNLDHMKRHESLLLWKKYNPEEYPKYYNYDVINVDKTAEIPCDYDGLMSVPITFLSTYNPDQFEIIGCPNYKGEYGRDHIGVKRLGEKWLNKYREQGGTGHYTANMAVPVYFDSQGNAQRPYSKIIIRKKI